MSCHRRRAHGSTYCCSLLPYTNHSDTPYVPIPSLPFIAVHENIQGLISPIKRPRHTGDDSTRQFPRDERYPLFLSKSQRGRTTACPPPRRRLRLKPNYLRPYSNIAVVCCHRHCSTNRDRIKRIKIMRRNVLNTTTRWFF